VLEVIGKNFFILFEISFIGRRIKQHNNTVFFTENRSIAKTDFQRDKSPVFPQLINRKIFPALFYIRFAYSIIKRENKIVYSLEDYD